MNRMMMTAVVAVALVSVGGCKEQPAAEGNDAATAAAATGIDGTWTADLASVKWDQAPDEFLLKDGSYTCSTCLPTPISNFAADGAFHPVADRASYDSMSVSVVDDKSVKFVRKQGDKEVGNNTFTISADGKSATNSWVQMNNANGQQTTGSATLKRVGDAPAGAHALSGKWSLDKPGEISPEALTATYKVEGETLNGEFGTGEKFAAKLDGTPSPVEGDAGGTMISAMRDGDGYKLSYSVKDKVVDELTITPNADGTMNVVAVDPRDKSKVTYTLRRK